MTIKVGDRVPDARVWVMTDKGPAERATAEIFQGRTVAVFGVPGAFTPTCHAKHLPGFVDSFDDFKARGIDAVACVSVNDAFVLDAWGKQSGADGKILFLADGNAELTRAMGLDYDATGVGRGVRSKRYSMLVEDGVVRALNVEEATGKVDVSGADTLIKSL